MLEFVDLTFVLRGGMADFGGGEGEAAMAGKGATDTGGDGDEIKGAIMGVGADIGFG